MNAPDCIQSSYTEECEANARLIAAAPDMLEALEALAATDFGLDGKEFVIDAAARKARQAIAAAKGNR